MPENCNSEVFYFGLKLFELLTLIGIIIGPVIAVIITLITESKRRKREGQIQVMRMLLNTRHMPADPSYSVAINLVPVEFNDSNEVMTAWEKYIDVVRLKPTPENQVSQEILITNSQTALIYRIMKSLGFNLSETSIQSSAYVSEGFIFRDKLYIDSLVAMRDIAEVIKQQNEFMRKSIVESRPTDQGNS